MKSDLVVISWWSNCLGLDCLHRLVEHTRLRRIYVVQAGKPEEQKESFRAYLPPQVEELPYPAEGSGEDWRVRETVARELLRDRAGLWFIDHDLFLLEDGEGWLEELDRRFEGSNICLCHPVPRRGPSITNPAFWLSPVRFPAGMPSFARVPYQEDPATSQPWAARPGGPAALILPEKDTLVAAMEFLQERGMVGGFPLTLVDQAPPGEGLPAEPPPFPRYDHIGGLYTFTGSEPPVSLDSWLARCVDQFTAFYTACPPEWVAIEDPVLLARLEEFRQAVAGSSAAESSEDSMGEQAGRGGSADPPDDRVSARHDLPFACTRRRFFPALLREATVTLGMLRGGQGGRLSELGSLPDEELALVRPVVNPAFEIVVEEDCVCGRHKKTGEVTRLFSTEETEKLVTFNLFDGRVTLDQIGRRAAQEFGWEQTRGFAYAREFFLALVGHLVCLPANPPALGVPARSRPPTASPGEVEGAGARQRTGRATDVRDARSSRP